MSKKRRKKPFSNWEGVGQPDDFKQMHKTVPKHFRRMHRTMDKDFAAATEDFHTIGPTQTKAYVPGQKVTMGTINPKKARRQVGRK